MRAQSSADTHHQEHGGSSKRSYAVSFADTVVDTFIQRPCTCLWSYCCIMMVLCVLSVLLGAVAVSEQDDAWTVWEAEATKAWKALDYAQEDVDRLPGSGARRRLPSLQHSPSMNMIMVNNAVLSGSITGMPLTLLDEAQGSSPLVTMSKTKPSQRRLQEEDDDGLETLYLYFKVSGSGSVFNPASLKVICDLEQHLRSKLSSGALESIASWATPLRLFYGSPITAEPAQRQLASSFECVELPEANISATVQAMHMDVQELLSSSLYAPFVHPDFLESMSSPVTSTRIEGPAGTLKDMADDALDRLGLKYGFLQSAYQVDDDRFTALAAGTRVRVVYSDLNEFNTMIGMDLMLAIFSFIFVFVVMYAYLGSLFLATFGMFQIAISLPLGALLYKGVFQITYFETVHILVIYLVLGIGADDIFVLVDTFKHVDVERRGNSPWTEQGFREVLKTAYMRSATAIFNTSFTTAVAFLASSGSKVMPMRTCGWFAAICIIMNFLLAITFTPVLVVLWHTRFQGKRCCSLNWSRRQEEEHPDIAVVPSQNATGEVPEVDEESQQQRQQHGQGKVRQTEAGGLEKKSNKHSNGLFELIIAKSYLPFMSTSFDVGRVSIRPGSLLLVFIMIIVAIQGAYFALQLTPPDEVERWYPGDHMAVEFSEYSSSVSFSPDHENYAIIGVFWGIQGLDTDNLDVYKPDDFESGTVFDGSFDLSNPDAQAVVLETCQKLRSMLCTDDACKNNAYSERTLMMQSSEKTWSCFLEDFRDYIIWRNGDDAWPLARERFNDELLLFRANASGDLEDSGCCQYGDALDRDYMEDIGFIGGELKYVQIRIRSTVQWETPFGKGVDVRDLMRDWINGEVRSGVPGMGSVKFHAQGLFASYDVGEELVNGLFQGVAIAAPIAFVVLLASTWNIVVSFYAVSCVGGIVLCVLGFCKSAMNWDLGIAEAIAGVIVLGYSVDYVVHLSHIYCEGGFHHGLVTRGEKAAFAIANMGSTVFAGAITTAGSAVVMYLCFFTFFHKMATLITVTIMYAFLFSLGLLMGLLWTVGPEGDFGNLYCIYAWVEKRCTSTSAKAAGAVGDAPQSPSGASPAVDAVAVQDPNDADEHQSPRSDGASRTVILSTVILRMDEEDVVVVAREQELP